MAACVLCVQTTPCSLGEILYSTANTGNGKSTATIYMAAYVEP